MARSNQAQYASLIKDVQEGKFEKIYLLHGEEPYFIDLVEEAIIENALEDSQRDFNQSIFYGRDTTSDEVADAARRFPMMANRQLVVLREAQDMNDFKKLEEYVTAPSDTCVLVISHKHKKLDGRLKFVQLLKKNACCFESPRVYDNQMPAWIQKYLKEAGLEISLEDATLIGSYLGTQLNKVANELKKIKLNLQEGDQVTKEDIQKYIGISKDFNVFELQKAMSYRKPALCTRIANYFAANLKDHPIPLLIGGLYSYFSKLYIIHGMKGRKSYEIQKAVGLPGMIFKEYQQAAKVYTLPAVQEAIRLLYEYDLKSKGGLGSKVANEELVREMIYLLYHAGERQIAHSR